MNANLKDLKEDIKYSQAEMRSILDAWIKYVGKSIIIRNVAINFISIQIENLH
jgi:hypothetical protein